MRELLIFMISHYPSNKLRKNIIPRNLKEVGKKLKKFQLFCVLTSFLGVPKLIHGPKNSNFLRLLGIFEVVAYTLEVLQQLNQYPFEIHRKMNPADLQIPRCFFKKQFTLYRK